MPTGNKRVNLYNKRNVPQEGWENYFFTFLDAKVNDTTRATFLSGGVLDDKPIGLSSSVNDTITFDLADADRGIDNDGHIIDLSNLASSLYTSYPFENATGDTYYFGFRYQSVPDDIENNPRSGIPKYPWYLETIGELGNPDNVTDNTTDITLEIDGILENGVDHSGRPFRIWLVNPVSPVDSIGYYSGTIAYSGGINKVVIPYTPTAGPLGQTAPAFPISLTALDYVVHVQGISWFKNTDISTVGDYVFVGTALGNGPAAIPTVFDISGQNPVFFISLDRAYRANSLDTPAPGRTIIADKWAVRIKQSASVERSWDPSNSAFEVDKTDETVSFSSSFKALIGGGSNLAVPFSSYRILQDGTNLQPDEAVSMLIGTDTITFDRAAIDLTVFEADYLSGEGVFLGGHFCIVEGTTNNTYDGAYLIVPSTILADRFDVVNLDGSSPVFPSSTSGTLNVFVPSFVSLSSDLFLGSHSDYPALMKSFPAGQNGFELLSYGEPIDPELMHYKKVGARSEGSTSWFYQLLPGRIRMVSGGSKQTNFPRVNGVVSGWAQFQSDKRFTSGLSSAWLPTEVDTEWGFDYRGTDFAKTTDDLPGYQLAFTSRIPFKYYDGGNDYIRVSEAFTRVSLSELQLTRAGVDVSVVPALTNMYGACLCEIEFDTPSDTADGLYVAFNPTAVDTLQFKKVDGSGPNFPVGTGTIRMYGGAVFGPVATNTTGGSKTWVADFTPPTLETGGLRIGQVASTFVSSSDKRYYLYLANQSIEAFSVRDGGQTFAKALTTKAITTFFAWDEIQTTNLRATKVHLSDGLWDLTLPDLISSADVVKRTSGGNWSETKHLNIFKGTSSLTGTTNKYSDWACDLQGAYVTSVQTASDPNAGYYTLGFYVPQGAVITSINLYALCASAAGTANSFGVNVMRKTYDATLATTLHSGGMQYANGGPGVQYITFTPNQNNTVNNDTFAYTILIKASLAGASTTTDTLYGAQVNFTVAGFGKSWFDCF